MHLIIFFVLLLLGRSISNAEKETKQLILQVESEIETDSMAEVEDVRGKEKDGGGKEKEKGIPPLVNPVIDSEGNIWYTNTNTNINMGGLGKVVKIFIFNSWNKFEEFSVGSYPMGIAIDKYDSVWVTNEGDDTVTKLSNDGVNSMTFSVGSLPWGIAIDQNDCVWIMNSMSGTTTKLANNGVEIGIYNTGMYPINAAIDISGNIWIVCELQMVTKLNNSGFQIGSYSINCTAFTITIDGGGKAWIPCYYSDSLITISSSGLITTQSLSSGTNPTSIIFDNQNNIWIASYYSQIISKIGNSGSIGVTYILSDYPVGLSIDQTGNIWIISVNMWTTTYSIAEIIPGVGLKQIMNNTSISMISSWSFLLLVSISNLFIISLFLESGFASLHLHECKHREQRSDPI